MTKKDIDPWKCAVDGCSHQRGYAGPDGYRVVGVYCDIHEENYRREHGLDKEDECSLCGGIRGHYGECK